MKYKLLEDCKQGDWVYYNCGELYMVDQEEGAECMSLTTGHFRCLPHQGARLYPLTLHNKIIADDIHWYYKEMHKYNLINGSTWVNWLDDKMYELMELDDSAPGEEYQKIWREIKNNIEELKNKKNQIEERGIIR